MRSKGEKGASSGNRVLVIDDEPEITTIVVKVLESHGFHALGHNDPVEVIEIASKFLPDLILLDFDMTKLSGPEAAIALKSHTTTEKIPIIFLSGLTDEDHRLIATVSGAIGYLIKPIDEAILLKTIREALKLPGSNG